MEIRLKIIVDNLISFSRLKAEHGFCMLIETADNKILFDTGQSSLLIENSLKMGIDLRDITKVVISHGHYDHTGGLLSLLEYIDREVEVFAHPGIFEKKYSRKNKEKIEFIGIPEDKTFYEKLGAKLLLVDKPLEIEKSIFISGQIPRTSDFENVEDYFVKKIDNIFVKDEILDDISIIICTGEGNILITGCAHSGLVNTIDYAEQITGVKEFKFINGGFHLSNKKEDYKLNVIKHLKEKKFTYISPAHCTGADATCLIKNHFGSKALDCGVGKEFEFKI
jgi:7,8-dihydropterin-6-yl-methyl-4-(beta-D-ribofuranosyl)aminobenzene 5'-phosphate synthase